MSDLRHWFERTGATYKAEHEGRFDTELAFAERRMGIKFPEDYKALFNQLRGASLGTSVFEYHRAESPMFQLCARLGFFNKVSAESWINSEEDASADPGAMGLMESYEHFQGAGGAFEGQTQLIPIAVVGDASYIFLDYRKSEIPSVCMYDEGFIWLAANVTDWLRKMVRHAHYRRVMIIQYLRVRRAWELSPALSTREIPAITKIQEALGHIMSDESVMALTHSDTYMGEPLERAVDYLLSSKPENRCGYTTKGPEDMEWLDKAQEDTAMTWELAFLEKRFSRPLPEEFATHIKARNDQTPLFASTVALLAEDMVRYASVRFMSLSGLVKGADAHPCLEAAATVDQALEALGVNELVSNALPIAEIDEELGWVCIDLSEESHGQIFAVYRSIDGESWCVQPLANSFEDWCASLLYEVELIFYRVMQVANAMMNASLSGNNERYLLSGVGEMLGLDVEDLAILHPENQAHLSLDEKVSILMGGYWPEGVKI